MYRGIPYLVKQRAGDRGITTESMEKSQRIIFNKDMTNESAVWSVATYGCESWALRRNEETRFDDFELKILR